VVGTGLPEAGVYVRLGRTPDSRLVCTGVHIGDEDAGHEVTATDLRRVPLAAILGDAARYLAGEGADSPLHAAVMRKIASDWFRQAAPFIGARTRPGPGGLPPEHFERVAEAYRAALSAAPRRPIQYLAEKFNVPEPTLRRWVQRARDRGLLGPATPGKAGEQQPKRDQE
jgi:hypothetical protein